MEYRVEAVPMSQNQTESPPTARELKDKIRGRSAKAGVVGLGYVGLPLAMEMAHTGFQVTGIDLVKEKWIPSIRDFLCPRCCQRGSSVCSLRE